MSALDLTGTVKEAPKWIRAAAVVNRDLPLSKVPRFGTKAWRREEYVLYRGLLSFRCNVCKRVVSASVGGSDDMPDACSDCWAKAHAAEDETGAK